jgi:hypothetical protein
MYPPWRHLVILDGRLSSCCFPCRLSNSEALRFASQADLRRRLTERDALMVLTTLISLSHDLPFSFPSRWLLVLFLSSPISLSFRMLWLFFTLAILGPDI